MNLTDYFASTKNVPGADYWWNLMEEANITLPSDNVKEFFFRCFPKRQYKISTKYGFVRTTWLKNNCRRCLTSTDVRTKILDNGIVTVNDMDVMYEKFITSMDSISEGKYGAKLLTMITAYIHYYCIDDMQKCN